MLAGYSLALNQKVRYMRRVQKITDALLGKKMLWFSYKTVLLVKEEPKLPLMSKASIDRTILYTAV